MYKGIDVSKYQGVIDWDAVKKAGLDFAILRCGYGTDLPSQDDPYFERNVSECDRLGIPYGVYLYSYALSIEDAHSEAKHVLRLLKNKKPSYPVYIDIEYDTYKNRHGITGKQLFTDIVKTFCEDLEADHYFVGWYTNKEFYEGYIYPEQLKAYTFWYARPHVSNPEKYGQAISQTEIGTTGGHWAGINGACDTDICSVDFPKIIKSKGFNGFDKTINQTNPTTVQPKPESVINVPDYYMVQYGDTLSGIAERFHTTVANLAAINHIANPNLIRTGQKLVLKGSVATDKVSVIYYVVKPGDTLSEIAIQYKTSVKNLCKLNPQIKNPDRIYAGQRIRVK
ncbi:MAG: LysM peptidoglycan-binding domain-containing protein [Clostridiales bacterium]|nr:LysM peptidoglycan-binding domain-containing protein [Clostridiales bacterium]